jgi:osmotically inducible protein OsmC
MSVRQAEAEWRGDLLSGSGIMRLGSGAFEGQYSFGSRFEEGTGTNPEELIGAAHAGCFSMSLGNMLSQAGFRPTRLRTRARVHLDRVDGSPTLTRIDLDCEGHVPGIDDATFMELAAKAKAGCPVSRALAGVDIRLEARRVDA